MKNIVRIASMAALTLGVASTGVAQETPTQEPTPTPETPTTRPPPTAPERTQRPTDVDKDDQAKRDLTKARATGTAKVDDDILEFFTNAAQSNMMEIQTSKLANQRANRKNVRDYAGMLVNDHQTMGKDLQALATNRSVALPTMLEEDKREKLDELAKKNGLEFDKAYSEMMVDAHEDAIELFQDFTDKEEAKFAEIETFASKYLPILKGHHKQAKDLRSKLDELTRR